MPTTGKSKRRKHSLRKKARKAALGIRKKPPIGFQELSRLMLSDLAETNREEYRGRLRAMVLNEDNDTDVRLAVAQMLEHRRFTDILAAARVVVDTVRLQDSVLAMRRAVDDLDNALRPAI